MLLEHVPFAGRVWALAFLTALAPSGRYAQAQGRRHKPLTERAPAYVQASWTLATGSQGLLLQTAESTRSAFTETFAGVYTMASATTVKERIELQTTFFRMSATRAVSEGSRFARASIDLAESASAPLQARAVAAAEAVAALKA